MHAGRPNQGIKWWLKLTSTAVKGLKIVMIKHGYITYRPHAPLRHDQNSLKWIYTTHRDSYRWNGQAETHKQVVKEEA